MQVKDAYQNVLHVCNQTVESTVEICVHIDLLFSIFPFKEKRCNRNSTPCPNQHKLCISGVNVNETYENALTFLPPGNLSRGNNLKEEKCHGHKENYSHCGDQLKNKMKWQVVDDFLIAILGTRQVLRKLMSMLWIYNNILRRRKKATEQRFRSGGNVGEVWFVE